MAAPTTGDPEMVDAAIRGVESQYTAGSWASARATLEFKGTERQAMAAAHRLVADLIEAAPASARWSLPTAQLVGSHRDRATVRIEIELATGSEVECRAAIELLHDVIPALDA
jgi:hypothetical protein